MNTDEFFPWLARQEAAHELVDGQPVAFAGITHRHNNVAITTLTLFDTDLAGTHWDVLNSQIGLIIPNGNVRYADLSVDTGKGCEDDRWATEPVLAALVLSNAPRRCSLDLIDRIEDLKTVSSLNFLLLIDSVSPRLRLYSRGAEGDWESKKYGILGRVNLPEIGLSFRVTDLYGKRSITTAEAAEYLDCGRVSIAQLCEGKNLESETSSNGERRISLDSLIAWKQASPGIESSEIKKANTEMGLYDIPEGEFLKPVR